MDTQEEESRNDKRRLFASYLNLHQGVLTVIHMLIAVSPQWPQTRDLSERSVVMDIDR